MAKLTWSGERYLEQLECLDAPHVTLDMDMKEADFSNKHLGVSGAIILAAFIKRKSFQDNGALASLDISNNSLTQGELKCLGIPDLGHKTDMSGVIALCEALKK